MPFSVSLTDFYSSPSLPHFSFSLSHVSPSESNCTFFKFYTSGENAVIFKKTTQKSKFFLYTLLSFSLCLLCVILVFALSSIHSLFFHTVSLIENQSCVSVSSHCSMTLHLSTSHTCTRIIILELLSCSILISVYTIPECPNKIHPKYLF